MTRRHKYNARKTVIDGYTFDSRAEARRYQELKLLEKQRLISRIELQPAYVLQETFKNGKGKTCRSIKYIADFRYYDLKTGECIVEDVKGQKTSAYQIKKKWFEKLYYPQTITEVQA